MKKMLFIAALMCVLTSKAGAVTLPLPEMPPIESLPEVQVEGGAKGVAWDANTETDLAGYLLFYSLTPFFEYVPANVIDIAKDESGDIATNAAFDSPDLVSYWVAGTTICFGVAAYDEAENVSVINSTTDAGEDVCIDFFEHVDPAPATPSGVSLTY